MIAAVQPLAATIGLIAGACVGSFVGTALVRLPEGRSILVGRSACDACRRRLTPGELVPVISWLVLRGRCRDCAAPIGAWQIVAELGGAVIGLVAWASANDALRSLAIALFGWQLLLLALLDARHFWLPLRLVGALALTGLAMMTLIAIRDHASVNVLVPLAGAGLGWGALALVRTCYQRLRGIEGMGAGDPWLMGAVGLWLGPLGVIECLLGASLVGIVSAVVLLALGRRVAADTALPLGTCIAVAAGPLFCLQGFG